MKSNCLPDLSSRPLQMTCECFINASPNEVYEAWTRKFDLWFAQKGTLSMTPEVDKPYFFYNKDEWGRHPHYGRFLNLEKSRLIEMTWMTGNGTTEGTEGAETADAYYCPMKCEGDKTYAEAGTCPKCGMDMVLLASADTDAGEEHDHDHDHGDGDHDH